MQAKKCTKCEASKPATTEYFYRYKASKDGLSFRCKECLRRDLKNYQDKHRDKYLQGIKDWHRRNRERDYANAEKRRQLCPDVHKRARRKFQKTEKFRRLKKRYRTRHREQVRRWKKMNSKRQRQKLSNYVVKEMLSRTVGIKKELITPALIAIKREQVFLKRTLREIRRLRNESNPENA